MNAYKEIKLVLNVGLVMLNTTERIKRSLKRRLMKSWVSLTKVLREK